jgi:hypothetical protein
MKEIFSKYSSFSALISRTCKDLKNIKQPKSKYPNQCMGYGTEHTLSNDQKIWKMTDKYMKKVFNIFFQQEMQIKTTLRFYHILVKMAIFKKINKIMCSKGAGE